MPLTHSKIDIAGSTDNYFDQLGKMALLLGTTNAFSDVKMNIGLSLINGALVNKTYALYMDAEGKPVAGVTWAYLNRENTDFYLINGVLPDVSAWRSGPDLWLLTMIAEGGNIRTVFKDMLSNVFKDAKEAFMLRPSPDGTRRIVRVTHSGMKVVRTLPGSMPD